MEQQQAIRILKALANGMDPATGESFAADSPYQHPDTVRALFEAVGALESARTSGGTGRRKPPASLPANTGSRWTPEEEERLAQGFDAGRSVEELARELNRTRAAIEARLVRIGKLDASAVSTPLRYPAQPAGQPPQRR